MLGMIGTDLEASDWSIDAIVAKDGSGDYTDISEAIANNPNDGSDYVIFIKNGVYDEQLFITTHYITLLGENRDSTIITQAILRRVFNETHEDDWGAATINIADDVHDLTLANLTVQNNFADVYPDFPEKNDHTMAIRGGGDKIVIVNCNIIATGGDTLSLWNTGGGRYYHSGCYFEGYVDFVCPRGYCFIKDSDFFGHNRNASIWHDGSGGKDHKLVVRNSFFDGVEDFGLGRFHRMSAFYLLDCDFSENLRNNGGILYVGDSSLQDRDKLIYGVRVYYDRCNRTGGDYPWHEDNLFTAENSPANDTIDAGWTFMNSWDPEAGLKGLLGSAFLPSPGYHAKEVMGAPVLSWLPGKDAVTHLLYFGPDSALQQPETLTDTFFVLAAPLSSATQYFWRVDEVTDSGDTIRGNLWTFFTEVSEAPRKAYNPYPPVGTNYTLYTVKLQWEANEKEVDQYSLYFGSPDLLELLSSQIENVYYLYGLPDDSTYYWRVDCENGYGITTGDLWQFDYRKSATSLTSAIIADQLKINRLNDELILYFNLPAPDYITLKVTNLLGQVVYTEYLGMIPSSTYSHRFSLLHMKRNRTNQLMLLSVHFGSTGLDCIVPFI